MVYEVVLVDGLRCDVVKQLLAAKVVPLYGSLVMCFARGKTMHCCN
jgi:hypothetical protein